MKGEQRQYSWMRGRDGWHVGTCKVYQWLVKLSGAGTWHHKGGGAVLSLVGSATWTLALFPRSLSVVAAQSADGSETGAILG